MVAREDQTGEAKKIPTPEARWIHNEMQQAFRQCKNKQEQKNVAKAKGTTKKQARHPRQDQDIFHKIETERKEKPKHEANQIHLKQPQQLRV